MLAISKPNDAKAFAIGANCLLHLFDDIVNHFMFSMLTFIAWADKGVVLYPPWVDLNDVVGKWIKDNNVAMANHYPKRYIIPDKIDTLIFCSFDDACVPKVRFKHSGYDKTIYSFYHAVADSNDYDLYYRLKEKGYIEDVPFISDTAFRVVFQTLYKKTERMWKPKNKILLSYDSRRAPAEMRDRLLQYDEVIKEVIPSIKTIQVNDDGEKHSDGVWCHYVDKVKHDVYNQIFNNHVKG